MIDDDKVQTQGYRLKVWGATRSSMKQSATVREDGNIAVVGIYFLEYQKENNHNDPRLRYVPLPKCRTT